MFCAYLLMAALGCYKTMQISELKLGDRIPASSFTLEPNKLKDYIGAVEESSGHFTRWSQGVVAPPIACVSLAMASMFKGIELPEGAVHLSQEISLNRPVKIGETFLCRASVIRNQVRGNLRIMTMQLEISDEGGERVLKSETGFIISEPGNGAS